MKYCEENNMDVNKIVPLTIFVQYNSPSYLNQFDNFSSVFNSMEKYMENQTDLNLHNIQVINPDKVKKVNYNDFFSLGSTYYI